MNDRDPRRPAMAITLGLGLLVMGAGIVGVYVALLVDLFARGA